MIELGGYVGYSAVLFGSALKAHGGKLLSIEINPEMAAVANQLVELAGLRDNVHIMVGASHEVLEELVREKKELKEVELIFLDHWQKLYLPDLWLLEELGVLIPGKSMLVADNVIMPGAPDYLEWVKATPEEKKKLLENADVGIRRPKPELIYETVVPEFDTDFGKVCLLMIALLSCRC
jgi:catechol O-methyltransferase